jgi:CRP/FNR family cyclic AMP-dependent transcriptional regulator
MVARSVVVRGGVVTLAISGWPVHKPIAGGPTHAKSVKMAINKRMSVLARVPLFDGLTKRHMQAVARVCVSRRWAAGSCVVAEKSTDQICYIIVEGTVDVSLHGRTIAQLGPGEFFGEIALLDPGPRSATVTTATEMISVELSRQSFLEVAGDEPAILLRMLEALARRLRETTKKLPY